jgi:8-oxo-dGTP diphosphatase
MIRRYGRPVVGRSYRLRPGAYAILLRGREVLLTHQQEPRSEFQLPGGGIDAGESPLQALHREVFEETGWNIAAPRRLGAFRSFTFMPEYDIWAEKLCHIYLARPVRRHGPPQEAGHTAVWVSPEVAIEIMADAGNRDFILKTLF